MADRATIFGTEAGAYDRLRPRYPAPVIDMIVAGSPDLVIDAGCGTGIAASQVLDRGVELVGIEPDAKMAAIARSHGIDVSVTTLESWDPIPCDVLYAAQSWHWIDPCVGAQVAASAIRPGGQWLACWNLEIDQYIDDIRNSVYLKSAPELVSDQASRYLGNEKFHQTIAAGLEETGSFEPMRQELVHWIDRIDSQRFVDRLDSHSAHRMLPDERRARVRAALIEALGREVELQVHYATEVYSALRS